MPSLCLTPPTHAVISHIVQMIVGSKASLEVWSAAWGTAPQLQGVALWWSEVAATGWVMVALMAIAFVFASKYPRRLACLANTYVGKVGHAWVPAAIALDR